MIRRIYDHVDDIVLVCDDNSGELFYVQTRAEYNDANPPRIRRSPLTEYLERITASLEQPTPLDVVEAFTSSGTEELELHATQAEDGQQDVCDKKPEG